MRPSLCLLILLVTEAGSGRVPVVTVKVNGGTPPTISRVRKPAAHGRAIDGKQTNRGDCC